MKPKVATIRYVTDKVLAERYGVAPETIWRWNRNKGSFPKAVKLSEGVTRWKLDQIEAWEAAQAVAA